MKYFQASTEDKDTGCKILHWETPKKLFGLIDIQNILRVVHIVPMYTKNENTNSGKFILNSYMWK